MSGSLRGFHSPSARVGGQERLHFNEKTRGVNAACATAWMAPNRHITPARVPLVPCPGTRAGWVVPQGSLHYLHQTARQMARLSIFVYSKWGEEGERHPRNATTEIIPTVDSSAIKTGTSRRRAWAPLF